MSNDKPLPEAVREQIVREVETVVGHDLTCESQTAGCMCDFELRAIDMATALEKIARVAWEAAAQQDRAIDPKAAFISGYYAGQYLAGTLSDEDAWKQWVGSHPPPTPEDRK